MMACGPHLSIDVDCPNCMKGWTDMKRKIPELKFNDSVATVLGHFSLYESTKNVEESPTEKIAWKRGYACALLDTTQITRSDWDRLIQFINHPELRCDGEGT